MYQGRCIGSVGLHAKEPFCEKRIFVVKAGLHNIKIRSFQEEQFKRGEFCLIQITKGEFKNLWRGNYWRRFNLEKTVSFNPTRTELWSSVSCMWSFCAYRPSLYSFNIF